jgi:hypothetical protein
VPLLRIVVLGHHVHAGARLRAHDVVDDATQRAELLDVVDAGELVDVPGVVHGVEPAPGHGQPGGVGDQGLLDADLAAVGEARDHPRVLAPAPGEPLLGGGVAVGVLQALDVAGHPDGEPQLTDEPDEVHLHARLVAVGAGVDHAGGVGLGHQQRPQGGVHLGVEQHQVLAGGEARQRQLGAERHRAGGVDHDVHPVAAGQHVEVVGDRHRAGRGQPVDVRGTAGGLRGRPHLRDGGVRLLRGPVVHRDELHPRRAVDDLVDQAPAHEAGADESDPDGPALLLAVGEQRVDDDHAGTPARNRSALACSSNAGQAASLSEMALTGSGQETPKAGSS